MTSGKTSTGIVPLLSDLNIEIHAKDGGGWSTVITQKGITVAEGDTKTEPWVQTEIVKKLAKQVVDKTTHRSGVIQDAISQYFEEIKASDDGKALLSEPARKVIEATEAVFREKCNPPKFRICLKSGNELLFTNRELTAMRPMDLNDKWSAIERERLKATRGDFDKIIDYWFEIQQDSETWGAASEWEAVLQKLCTEISLKHISDKKERLLDDGIYREGEILWVSNEVIRKVLLDFGKDITDSSFQKYLRDEGMLLGPSKYIRVNGFRPRAWQFSLSIYIRQEEGLYHEDIDQIPFAEGEI
jgi:predicted transcriptional regulator